MKRKPNNITLYLSDPTREDLEYISSEAGPNPSKLLARAIEREARRIRRQREREQRQPEEANA